MRLVKEDERESFVLLSPKLTWPENQIAAAKKVQAKKKDVIET